MAIAFVQGNINGNASTASQACAFSSNQTAGNVNIVTVVLNGSNQTPSVSDSANGSYGSNVASSINGTNASVYIFVKSGIAGTANTVTATVGVATGVTVTVQEYSGLTTTVDGSAGTATGTGTTFVLGTGITTTNANDLIVSASGSNGAGPCVAGSGYIMRETWSFDPLAGTEDQIVTATGTFTGSQTAGNGNWALVVIAFQASSGGSINPSVSGSILVTGSVSPAFNPTFESVSGNILVTGTEAVQLAYIPSTFQGQVLVTGSVNPAFSPVQLSLSGTIAVTGTVSPTFIGGAARSSALLTYYPWYEN